MISEESAILLVAIPGLAHLKLVRPAAPEPAKNQAIPPVLSSAGPNPPARPEREARLLITLALEVVHHVRPENQLNHPRFGAAARRHLAARRHCTAPGVVALGELHIAPGLGGIRTEEGPLPAFECAGTFRVTGALRPRPSQAAPSAAAARPRAVAAQVLRVRERCLWRLGSIRVG